MGGEERLVGDEETTGHDEENAKPLRPCYMLVEDKQRRYHTHDIRHTRQRVRLRERIVLQNPHPQDPRRRERNSTAEPPPIGQLRGYKLPRPTTSAHRLQGKFHHYLPAAEQRTL